MEATALAERLADSLAEPDREPMSQLIAENVWLAVVDGTVDVGERLPTARELAVALRVSPRTVERAYAELERQGVVARRAGEGTFVRLTQPSEAELGRRRELTRLCQEMLERARTLGFGLDELLDALAEYREGERLRYPEP